MKGKNNLVVTGSVLLVILLCFAGTAYTEGTDLIPDDELLEAVSYQLGLPGEKITAYNMLDLVTLSASYIDDLTGLQYAKNLERLRLDNLGNFTEIDPLLELENLEILTITGSSIESNDIEGLGELDQLEILRLSDNRIESIKPLGELPSLRELYLSKNEVIELDGVEKLESLQVLHIAGNHLISITPLAGLKNLNYLDLSGNQLKSVKPLLKNEGLDKGDVIHIHNNLLDFSPNSKNIQNVKTLKSRGVQVRYLPQRTQVKGPSQQEN